ncbi:MAG: glycoside hydrolase family 65 protein [Anaerolineae bacterium]|jgi:kojibiose phosphorylase
MENNWYIGETSLDPGALHHMETIFTIGNGYLGTRGAFEEGHPGSWPATFVHGVFDDVPLVHTELVNTPNWLPFRLFVDGEGFRMDRGTVCAYRRDLNLQTGVLTRSLRWRSPADHTTDVRIERFASLADPHLMGIRFHATPLDLEVQLSFRAGLDGHVDNQGWTHWQVVDQDAVGQQGAYLHVRARGSGIELCQVCHLTVRGGTDVTYAHRDCDAAPAAVARLTVRPGETVVADKLVALVTSREVDDVCGAALARAQSAADRGYDDLRADSDAAWASEWESCNVTIEGDDEADRALRYGLFQLLIAAPRHDDRVSIPAKTLSGFGYRGHVFWDTEIFILPFFTFTQPRIARNLLMYRYHTLPGARRKAREYGYEGALFAWESADTGDETTPRLVPSPEGDLIRIWTGDIQHHISADVAYGVMQYWRVTGDDAFMRDHGAEIVLDTARFWGSRAEWNAARGRYEITDVIGPDEHHEHVDNNAYTNRMARWNLEAALEVLAWLRREHAGKAAQLKFHLDLTADRLARWADVIGCLYLPHDPETGLIEQFDGFLSLEAVELDDYEPRSHSMQAELGVEGIQNYQVIKQPDVLMLLYLLRDAYGEKTLRINWDYYLPCTDLSHGSSLGPSIHAALAARLGESKWAYEQFIHAAELDLKNLRGNTVDGIHAASAGGVWQSVVFGFAGLKLGAEGYSVTPSLPSHWKRLKLSFRHRGERIDLVLSNHDADEGGDIELRH